jgi:8-oxo-dGTP pyrophosphatase MutT (NUDIX family)
MTPPPEFDPATVPVRPAATVMLVRDGEAGLEVFMLRRTMAAVFAGGMYVFPGGRLDDADSHAELEALCAGRSDHDASAVLQIPGGGLAYWVAAIRECFEEAGVLLARPEGSEHYVQFADPAVAHRFEAYRRAVHAGELGLPELCRREGLVLAADAMEYVAHWITPVGEARRFDTRFLVARVPADQEPLHDDHETIDSLWVRPDEALARNAAGDLGMLPPTLANLRFLAAHPTADAVMAAAASVGVPPAILPKIRFDADGRITGIAIPGDPDYETL